MMILLRSILKSFSKKIKKLNSLWKKILKMSSTLRGNYFSFRNNFLIVAKFLLNYMPNDPKLN